MNEGRGLFPGDREFGRWLAKNVLSQVAIAHDDQAAAVWAAANRDDFDTARAAGNARTHGPPGPHKPLWWPRRILGESGQ